MDPESVKDEINRLEGFKEEMEILKYRLNSISENEENVECDKRYPVVTFLGTGSCIPNKTRNTSGILVSMRYISNNDSRVEPT